MNFFKKVKSFLDWRDLGSTGIPLWIWFILFVLMIYIAIKNIVYGWLFGIVLTTIISFTNYFKN